MLKTDIIAFFSAEHFFRLKTEEKQKEKFDTLQDDFFKEFPDYEGDYSLLFPVLIDYHKEQQKARKAPASRSPRSRRDTERRPTTVAGGIERDGCVGGADRAVRSRNHAGDGRADSSACDRGAQAGRL